MDGTLESLFNLYVFTTGRRLFAHREVRALAHAQGFTALTKHCDAAIAHDVATREFEHRWAGEPSGGNPAAQRIDVLVDRTLTAIRDRTAAEAQGAAPDDSIHAEAAAFVKRIFPVGVPAVTSLPFVDELAAVDDILKLLKGELAPAVREFGLARLVKRLADLAEQYRDALGSREEAGVDWGQVRAVRSEGQGRLLETVAIIVGQHHKRTPEGTEARRALLAPIMAQNDAIGQYLRARRAVTDVNPDTGTEDPSPPAAPKEPAGAKGNG